MSAAQETPARGIDTDVAVLRTLGPDRAFERMYRKHATEVYRYALAIVRDTGDAEDVTQTTFLNAFRALQRGERPQKAKSWLLAIAHNVCLQRFRNASRRPQQVAFDEELAEAAVPDESPSADDLVRALQQLSFNQRSALVMRELEGRSYAEIGEILGLQVSAVETLLFRARRALREQLETSITCGEAEELLSRQLDGHLPRAERGALRAHLRACEECAHLARSQRAQRSAWKALSIVPLPGSLGSLFGGGGGAVATGMAAKVAAVGAAAVLVGGGTYEGVRMAESHGGGSRAPVAAAPARPSAPVLRKAPRAPRPAAQSVAARAPAHDEARPAKGLGRHAGRKHDTAPPAGTSYGRGRVSAPGRAAGPAVHPGASALPGSAAAGHGRKPAKTRKASKKTTTMSAAPHGKGRNRGGVTSGSGARGAGQTGAHDGGAGKGQAKASQDVPPAPIASSDPASDPAQDPASPGQAKKR